MVEALRIRRCQNVPLQFPRQVSIFTTLIVLVIKWYCHNVEGGCFGDEMIIRDVDCFCDQMIIRDMHQELVISQNIGGQLQVNQNNLQ